MELLTHKDDHAEYTYYLNDYGRRVYHGKYKDYHVVNGQLWEISFYYHGLEHGECMLWDRYGDLLTHALYINGTGHDFVEMNDQEKLLFQIQHPGFRFIEE